MQKIGWPEDEELIEYLDRATSFLTDRMIAMRYNSLLKLLELDGPTELPEDFVTFVGKVPVQIIGNTAKAYSVIDIATQVARWRDPNIPDDDKRLTWGGKWEGQIETWAELTKTGKTTVLYWSRLPFPSTFYIAPTPEVPEPVQPELPYKQDENTLILDLARMFALNKNEYDLTQDMGLMSQIQSAMAQARGVADATDGDQ
jgi:hypothetical protein